MTNMSKVDGRILAHDTLEFVRRTAVQRVRNGERPSEVIKSFGFCRTSIYKWLRAAELEGDNALRSRKGTGRPPELSDEEKRKVRTWICGKDPRQHGFDFGLWTRKLVKQLIEERFGARLGLTTVGRLLAELGITPQKPLRRAYERDPEAVEHWTKVEYPKLKKRAKMQGAKVFFLDEAGVRSDDPPGRTWGARGETPIVRTSGQRQSVNAISAVNAQGGFWYSVYTGSFNATRFVKFLKDFMKGRRSPVFLVVDGHPSHKAKLVQRYVESTEGKLELHFLPPYAPDLNPDESVWRQIKKHDISRRPLAKGESLRVRVEQALAGLAKTSQIIRSFFREKSVAYILD